MLKGKFLSYVNYTCILEFELYKEAKKQTVPETGKNLLKFSKEQITQLRLEPRSF